MNNYEKYRPYINFIKKYRVVQNASTGSKYDANANVENKNVTTLTGELGKEVLIGVNRLQMSDKLIELYGEDLAEEYLKQLDNHEIYSHDETNPELPYCVSITMYPFLFNGMKEIGGISTAPKNLQSFCGSFVNLVFAIAAQFAGAVSTPEFLTYMDYFIRREYGDEYYKHPNKIVDGSVKHRSIDNIITQYWQQVVYSLNQPAAARNYQSVFWNVAYFDKPYFEGIFDDFVFPDGTAPNFESVMWLQKRFMRWFNQERLRTILTFPVETVNLLSSKDENGEPYFVDKDFADFVAEMWADGHSFFMYNSDSVDSLASCCFDGSQMTLSKSSDGVNLMSFKELYEAPYQETKRNFTIFQNGSWVKGKVIRLPKRKMYRVTTANKKTILVTDNHLNVTQRGDIPTSELTTNDYLMFNNSALYGVKEVDEHLTYEQGFLVGMYLGDGSMADEDEPSFTTQIDLSLNEDKYEESKNILEKACSDLGIGHGFTLNQTYNNVYPLKIRSEKVYLFIRRFVSGRYCFEKRLNPDCMLQSYEFRKGILDGYYLTDGGNSNRIYTTSVGLVEDIEVLITSLGMQSIIDVTDRRGEGQVIIRGQKFNRNYPVYCIRWYEPCNRRNQKDIYIKRLNSTYFKIIDISEYESDDDYVYCFEMASEDEPYFTLPNGIITHNCRLRNELQDNTFSYTLGAGGVSTGSKHVMTINFNRLIQNTYKSPDEYKNDVNHTRLDTAIREQVRKIHKYLIAYNEMLKENLNAGLLPVYNAGYISMDKQFLTIGINGLVEGAEYLGIKINPNDEYFDFCTTCLKPIYEENKAAKTKELMFNTEYVPAENLGVKNAKWDKEDGYFSPRDCYNSYFYRPEDETLSIIDKLILHGNKTTRWLDGGSALHMNLQEHLSKEQYKKIMLDAVKVGCGYLTFNVPNTICNDCGYISKHKFDKCPRCNSENVDWATRIIGYLKRISKFSEQRQIEASKRYYINGSKETT